MIKLLQWSDHFTFFKYRFSAKEPSDLDLRLVLSLFSGRFKSYWVSNVLADWNKNREIITNVQKTFILILFLTNILLHPPYLYRRFTWVVRNFWFSIRGFSFDFEVEIERGICRNFFKKGLGSGIDRVRREKFETK